MFIFIPSLSLCHTHTHRNPEACPDNTTHPHPTLPLPPSPPEPTRRRKFQIVNSKPVAPKIRGREESYRVPINMQVTMPNL